jgi:hypothetical protein
MQKGWRETTLQWEKRMTDNPNFEDLKIGGSVGEVIISTGPDGCLDDFFGTGRWAEVVLYQDNPICTVTVPKGHEEAVTGYVLDKQYAPSEDGQSYSVTGVSVRRQYFSGKRWAALIKIDDAKQVPFEGRVKELFDSMDSGDVVRGDTVPRELAEELYNLTEGENIVGE